MARNVGSNKFAPAGWILIGHVFIASLVIPANTQAQTATGAGSLYLDGGLLGGAVVRVGESWKGSAGGYGGWISVGGEQLRLEIDVMRSNKMKSSGTACVDHGCTQAAQGTSSIGAWIIGAVALWNFRVPGPAVPHVIAGIGGLRNVASYDFNDSTIPDTASRNTQNVFIGGIGVDFRTATPVFGRVEYRLNYASLDTTVHQFQVGAGFRF